MPGTELVKRPDHPPVPVQPRRESEAMIPAAFRKVRRNRHASVPLAVPPVMWTAGEILHAFALTPETAVAGGAVTVAVWFFAPHKWDRGPEQWYARLSVTAAGTYLPLAAAFGASSGLPGMILGGFLVAGGAAWGIPWFRHYRPRGRRRRQKMIARWDAWWQSHCWGWNLRGSGVIDASVHRVTVKIRVQLVAGQQSLQHVKQSVHLIESALQGMADIGMIRVETVKGRPDQVDLFMKRENPLREPVQWEAAVAPRSVHEDWTPGMNEAGAWVHLPQRKSSFVIGATRTGKSNHLLLRALCLAGCPDAVTVLIDLKGGRSARPVLAAQAADYVVTGVDEARMWLLLACTEIHARAKYCYTGEEQLEGTIEIPAVFTLIDETHGLTSVDNGDSECARLLSVIASQGAGLEFYADVYTQYGSLEASVRTEQTRMNLPVRVTYRVEQPAHAAFAIPEYDKLDASKLEEQGTCYVKDGPQTRPEQVRDIHMPHSLFAGEAAVAVSRAAKPREWVLYCGGQPCPAGGTWQQWWDARWLRLDPAFRRISPQYQAAAEAAGGAETVNEEQPQAAHAVPAAPVSPAQPSRDEDARRTAERIEAESAQGAPADFEPDRRAVSRLGQVIARQKEDFADALADAGPDGISPDQLIRESGRSRTWVYQMLKTLSDKGIVIQVRRGLYAAAGGADVSQAIRAIEEHNDVLLRQAKRKVRELQAS